MSSSVATAGSSTPTPSTEGTRRHLSARQAQTVQNLAAAAVDELRAVGYEGLTVRNVARRAGVAPATAYTYFASRDHLVTEVFWRRLQALPDSSVDRRRTAAHRVAATLTDLALLVSDEPEVAAACSTAMLANDPDVAALRLRIGVDMRRRCEVALGDDATEPVLRALDLVITGALIHAGTGHLTYAELPGRLAEAAELLLEGAR